jgi:GTP-binding protein
MRKGELQHLEKRGERAFIKFRIPSRGIIGLRNEMLTATAGEAVMAHRFESFEPYKGDLDKRNNGSLVSMELGTAFAYALDKLQDRGKFFIAPQEEVYEGQVIGEHIRAEDLVVNVTKSKKLTNMRASGSDDKVRLAPPIKFSLEEALEYIREDELVEITPASIRLRKMYLKEHERKRGGRS